MCESHEHTVLVEVTDKILRKQSCPVSVFLTTIRVLVLHHFRVHQLGKLDSERRGVVIELADCFWSITRPPTVDVESIQMVQVGAHPRTVELG